MKITAHIEFDSAAEAAAFFGQYASSATMTFAESKAQSAPVAGAPAAEAGQDGKKEAGADQSAAQAEIAAALARAAEDKAARKGKRQGKAEAEQPAPTAAPSPAPTEAPAAPAPTEPAKQPEAPANDQPTATGAPEPAASSDSEQDFFGSTSQDANATAAPQSVVYTYPQIHNALFAWSKRTVRPTFASLMEKCGAVKVEQLEGKADLFPMIVETIEQDTGMKLTFDGDNPTFVE